MRRRLERLTLPIVAALIGTLLFAVGPLPANAAVPTYYVSVYSNGVYKQTPDFGTRVSPALPLGAALTGRVTCSEVYDNGDSGPTEPVTPPNGLAPGTYYFVTSSCTSDPTDPLTLTGASGNLQILGDVYNIAPDQTYVQGAATETGPSSAPTSVTLYAEVFNIPLDDSPMSGKTVNFEIQNYQGLWLLNVCSAVTAFNSTFTSAFAKCTLSSADAAILAQGTGAWTANYAGSGGYLGSSFNGFVLGATSAAQAEVNFQKSLFGEKITVTTYKPSPNCHPSDQLDTGIFAVSLASFSCSQLHVLQYVTGAVLFVTTIFSIGAAETSLGSILAQATSATARAGGQAGLNLVGDAANAAQQAVFDSAIEE